MSFLPEFWEGGAGRGTWEPWVTPLGFSLVGVPRPAGWGDPGNRLDQGDLQREQAGRPENLTLACPPQSAEPLILHRRNSLKSLSSDFFFLS